MRDVKRITGTMVDAIEGQRWLDGPGYTLEHALALAFTAAGAKGRGVQDVLHGTPLGHPLHPALTDVPIGAWTTALVLDAFDMLSPAIRGLGASRAARHRRRRDRRDRRSADRADGLATYPRPGPPIRARARAAELGRPRPQRAVLA